MPFLSNQKSFLELLGDAVVDLSYRNYDLQQKAAFNQARIKFKSLQILKKT